MKELRIEFYIYGARVLPRVTSIKNIARTISLNRKGDGCYNLPKDFKYHDDHAPDLCSLQEEQDYINRVTKDILEAWAEAT